MQRRRRYGRRQPPDLYANLGLGDPGYRLRPGASGLDPMETYAEYGRVIGTLLKSALTGRVGPFPRLSLALLGGLLLTFVPSFMGRLDVVVGRPYLWVEVTYATIGGLLGLVVWVALRALFRGSRGPRRDEDHSAGDSR